jgi:hypothetical protein
MPTPEEDVDNVSDTSSDSTTPDLGTPSQDSSSGPASEDSPSPAPQSGGILNTAKKVAGNVSKQWQKSLEKAGVPKKDGNNENNEKNKKTDPMMDLADNLLNIVANINGGISVLFKEGMQKGFNAIKNKVSGGENDSDSEDMSPDDPDNSADASDSSADAPDSGSPSSEAESPSISLGPVSDPVIDPKYALASLDDQRFDSGQSTTPTPEPAPDLEEGKSLGFGSKG